MNFQSIHYFLQVAAKRSFSQAAESLYITQQTLSASIASLEKELGCTLFIRHIPLELTYAGELFLKYALKFQQDQDRMLRELDELKAEKRGRFRVGVSITRGRMLLPGIIQAFHQVYPLITVEITEGKNDELLAALYEGRIDLVIAYFPGIPYGITLKDYYQEEIVLAVSNDLLEAHFGSQAEEIRSALTKEQDIRPLADLPFLTNIAQGATGNIGRNLLRQAGILPEIKAASGSMETLLEMCVRGEGAGFFPENLLRSSLSPEKTSELFLVHFPGKETVFTVRFGWLKDEKDWSVRNAFMEAALRQLPAECRDL